MSAAAVKAFLASLALFLVLAVWRRFLTLQGCRREGSFGVAAQVDLISEDLRDLKAVWDLLCKISFWGYNRLRFDSVELGLGE